MHIGGARFKKGNAKKETEDCRVVSGDDVAWHRQMAVCRMTYGLEFW